jgi:hypothetical protein
VLRDVVACLRQVGSVDTSTDAASQQRSNKTENPFRLINVDRVMNSVKSGKERDSRESSLPN